MNLHSLQPSAWASSFPQAGTSGEGFDCKSRFESPSIAVIVPACYPLTEGTSSSTGTGLWPETFVADDQRTASVVSWRESSEQEEPTSSPLGVTSRSLAELRRLSGLTWDQLGNLFGVSRRAVHFWASGEPMTAAHELHLHKALDVVRQSNRGSARSNRSALMTVTSSRSPFELLKSREFDEALARLGRRPQTPRPKRRELDARAKAERTPPPPHTLVEALHDGIPETTGIGGAARTVRNMQRETEG